MRIFAFIVTYNRLDSLKRVVGCVRNQTQQIDKLIIINNNSTDGTKEWLDTLEDVEMIHQDNLGGAGGFYIGVKTCYEQGADWIWMMDDDVFPQNDCLEHLLKYKDVSNCLNTTRYWADGGYVPQLFRYDIERNVSEELKTDMSAEYQVMNTCCFEGLLISSELVKQIGFPDKRFFIAGDDTIYGYLASKHTNVILVKDAIAIKLQKEGAIKPRPFYTYYFIRNYHLISEYKKKLTGKGFSFFRWFSIVFIVIRSILKFLYHNDTKMAMALYRGILDCSKGNIGKTFKS